MIDHFSKKKANMKSIKDIKNMVIPILRKHHISRAGIFGSFATNQYTEKSDIDILVQLEKNISLLEFVGIQLELEDVLQRKVDLVAYQAIKPRLSLTPCQHLVEVRHEINSITLMKNYDKCQKAV